MQFASTCKLRAHLLGYREAASRCHWSDSAPACDSCDSASGMLALAKPLNKGTSRPVAPSVRDHSLDIPLANSLIAPCSQTSSAPTPENIRAVIVMRRTRASPHSLARHQLRAGFRVFGGCRFPVPHFASWSANPHIPRAIAALQNAFPVISAKTGKICGSRGDDLARDCCAHHPVQWGAGSPENPILT
jgi:hypothetical protein